MASSSGVPDHIRHDDKLSAVFGAMHAIAPLSMADTAWDNVGILLQAAEPQKNIGNGVLLCNDLTTAVVDEALAKDANVAVIVTYHPIIFRGLKSLTHADTQQRSLLRLAAANVSVYAAHTSLDACTNGINDWLARIVAGHDPTDANDAKGLCQPIVPLAQSYDGHANAGNGRVLQFDNDAAKSVQQIVDNVKQGLGLKHLLLGLPESINLSDACITSVAVAAGSAASIVTKSSAQVYVTGEMSHHEALAAVEQGKVVILTLHGNSERKYLRDRLAVMLQQHAKLSVTVSEADREPLEIV